MKRKPEKLNRFYMRMLETAYLDLVGGLVSVTEQGRDLQTCRERFEREGLSFLTKTLPAYAKCVDKALATGTVLTAPGFKLRAASKLPILFGGLLGHLFTNTGIDRTANAVDTDTCCEADVTYCRETASRSLKAIRQLGYLFYKLELPFEEDAINETLTRFKDTDRELPTDPAEFRTLPKQHLAALCVARDLIHRLLCNVDPLSGIPKHGPGAVSTGEKSPDKHVFKRFYRNLNAVFPYDAWFYYNASHLAEDLEGLQSLQSLDAGTAKVVLVPKDSRGPRLISCEPLEYQWIQQSVMGVLVKHLETHRLTKGCVNFTRQEVNRSLAREGSVTGKLATLDMKDASDRVSLALVESLFPSNWVEALMSCRSPQTQLPDGTLVTLRKFAPMGSAVCFPVEALCFWALSVASLIVRDVLVNTDGYIAPSVLYRSIRLSYDHDDLHHLKRTGGEVTCNLAHLLPQYRVHVYGDDIICRTVDHGVIVSALEAFHLKVNADKCCTHGFFRESCGLDAFHGVDVSPVRQRIVLMSDSRQPVRDLPSLVGFANECWRRGLQGLSLVMEKQIRSLFPTAPIPIVGTENPSVIAFVRPGMPPSPGPNGRYRRNMRLHYREFQGLASAPCLQEARVDGYARMLREEPRRVDTSTDPRIALPSGSYPLAHRDKLKCAWTPVL